MTDKFAKYFFKKPKLLGLENTVSARAATPLELFFDLAFVVGIAHLVGILESSLSLSTLIYAVLKFMTIFIFWNDVTMYNQYFEDNTIIHRIMIFFAMIPILALSIDHNMLGKTSMLIYAISSFISRFYIIIMWYWASFKNENVYLKKLVRITYFTKFCSIIIGIGTLILFFTKGLNLLFVLFWGAAIFFEILYPVIKIRELNEEVDFENTEVPIFDRQLQMERYTLFTILILGEGLVGVSHFINQAFLYGGIYLSYALLLFIITFMILWIYMDYYSSCKVKIDYFLSLSYLNIFQVLGLFLIMTGFITLFDQQLYISQVIIAIGLFLFSITNIIIDKHRGDFIFEKYEHLDDNFGKECDFTQVRKSFYIDIVLCFFLLVWEINIYVVAVLVILVFLVNISLLVRSWISYT